MPAGKRQQSNAMLYTVITFVGLFIVTTTLAVIFYIKFEERRTLADDSQKKLEELMSKAEQRKGVSKIIGSIGRNKSGLGTMSDYLDSMVTLVAGGPLEDDSAETKVEEINQEVDDLMKTLADADIETEDVKASGLLNLIESIQAKLEDTKKAKLALEEELDQLRAKVDEERKITFEKEQTLLAEKEANLLQVEDIKKKYTDLKALIDQTSEQQVQILVAQLDEEQAKYKTLKQQLLKTEAKYKMAENRMKRAQEKLMKLVPPPDSAVAAFEPDGKIILIDDASQVVHLDIGSDDKVYRGLTFTVYDRSLPIPKDGKGKAEVEVFNVEKNISAARIISSSNRDPIIMEDIVANLIWDNEKTNEFVVSGDYDLDNNGTIDHDAIAKIEALIEKWGGNVASKVSIDTDFLVLGKAPDIKKRPTLEEMEMRPLAMEQYETSLKKLSHYKETIKLAKDLSIPVFNYERFLYFIGYKNQSKEAGAY